MDASSRRSLGTPHAAKLTREPKTPSQRTLTLTSLSSSSHSKNPKNAGRTPGNSAGRLAKEPLQSTPHGAQAIQQLRAARQTPGKNRRRSGQIQRETPRGILRALSKVLAPVSQPVQSSPRSDVRSSITRPVHHTDNDDLDENEPLPQPRLSMPTNSGDDEIVELGGGPDLPQPQFSLDMLPEDEDEDDNFVFLPPRLSVPLEDENITQKSVELPRRAVSEQPLGRYSRASFGSIRLSEYFDDTSRFYDKAPGLGNEPGIGSPESQNEVAELPGDEVGDSGFEQSMAQVDDTVQMHNDSPVSIDEVTFQLAAETSHTDVGPLASLEAAEKSAEESDANDDSNDEEQDNASAVYPKDEEQGNASDVSEALQESRNRSSFKSSRKIQKISRYGKRLPSIPTSIIKKLATRFVRSSGQTKPKLNKECIGAIEQASEWFFEQLGDDLHSYSEHAGRKTIDETDMVALMRRQRQLKNSVTLFSLGQKHLPRELLQEVRMPRP